MPTLSGEQIADELSGQLGDTQVIFYSCRSKSELNELTLRHAARGWIKKTGDRDAFLRKFERLVTAPIRSEPAPNRAAGPPQLTIVK